MTTPTQKQSETPVADLSALLAFVEGMSKHVVEPNPALDKVAAEIKRMMGNS